MASITTCTGRRLPRPFAAGGECQIIFITGFFDLPHELEPEFAWRVPAIMMSFATLEV